MTSQERKEGRYKRRCQKRQERKEKANAPFDNYDVLKIPKYILKLSEMHAVALPGNIPFNSTKCIY